MYSLHCLQYFMSRISLVQKLQDIPTPMLRVWENPRVFKLEAEGTSKKVAAVIPERVDSSAF